MYDDDACPSSQSALLNYRCGNGMAIAVMYCTCGYPAGPAFRGGYSM